MTTTTSAATTSAPAPSSATGRAIGWAAAAGTLPYLTLKAVWLTGGDVGVADRALLADPSVTVLNGVTVGLDLAVVALAVALTHSWGRRLPAWAVLLPTWVGTGLLLPVAAAILPGTLLLAAGPPTPPGPLEPWVQPLVYGGFAWQAIFLLAAFVLYARRRWSAAIDVPGVSAPSLAPLLRVLAAGGTVMAALSGGLHLARGLLSGSVAGAVTETVNAGFPVAAVVGVLALIRGAAAHRRLATAAAWVGSAAMFSWGLWTAATTLGATALATSDPLRGLAALTGLLGGFALAVAALLALLGTGVAHPTR